MGGGRRSKGVEGTETLGDSLASDLRASLREAEARSTLRRTPAVDFTEIHSDASLSEGGTSLKEDQYPHKLMKEVKRSFKRLMGEEDLKSQPSYILSNYLDQCQELIKEVHKIEWSKNIDLLPDDQKSLQNLQRMQEILRGYLDEFKKKEKTKEDQAREVARSLSFAKGPTLKENGDNIDAFLEYHDAFKATTPLARALKIKNNLPHSLQLRVENISDPDEIVQLPKDMFCSSDVLVPMALEKVMSQKIHPAVNSKEEMSSYTAINSLIKRLEKQGLLGRLDFTMISSCLARLSNTRIDQFELQWLKSKLSSPSLSTAAEEELKRTEFIQFIQIHEVLLQRKQIQNSLLQKDKPPKTERNMNTRETKLEKKRKNKNSSGGGGGGGANDADGVPNAGANGGQDAQGQGTGPM